ncbi:MAG: hypothetical protein CVU00_12300 [Bacteroidetes bacterium HGW-Bacteroidetes-17]|nr:MAG: hypothetical protein CVU00_12300 [Bacteroidetes bacterium HGW-Bacteroidetes-17]
MKKILFVDETHPVLIESFEKLGYQCDFLPSILKSEDDLTMYEGIVVRSKKINKQVISRATNLKFIGRVGAGMENIDVYFAEQKGIKCLNAPEGSRDAVGEHTVALLLAALNKIVSSDAEVKKGIWNRNGNWGTEIKGKTIGIIGYGNMGSSFAQKISGFGAEVIAYDKYKFNYTDQFVTETDLQTVFDKADILSLHVPITEETHFMVNDAFLQNFKKNIFLLNTSRGEVVKTADLVKHLKTGKVLAAGLDVLEYEKHAFEKLEDLPEDFQYLSQAKNVVFTPHVAGWTDESYYKLARVLFEKIKEVLN